MKKILKITGFVLLGLIFLLASVILFFNARYNTVRQEMAEMEIPATNASFYTFDLNPDSTYSWFLLPVPKEINHKPGKFIWGQDWIVDSELPEAGNWVNQHLVSKERADAQKATIRFVQSEDLPAEGHVIDIQPAGITIHYSTPAGAYYAVITLHHLHEQFPFEIESVVIRDAPDMEIRGVMIDISRDKVPTLETLKKLVDQFTLLKYNHIQLYVEGFSFGYPSFRDLWENETPLTPEEIQELDSYCKTRFIELVPNQNSLGHMQAWLETERYASLAECPDGYAITPVNKVKTTLDPSNPESIALIEQMMDDLLPNFSSDKFNANLDEPFELGHCRNEELAEEIGVGQIYLDFVLQVYELAKAREKEFWMWGDIISKHPELLDAMPKDITVLEWGYEQEHPFDANTARMQDKGFDFLVCPGTSSWMTFTGRTDNMLGNIENAVLAGIKNGGRGMLLTDWGDLGHHQYLPVSYPGFAFAGAISWNSSSSRSLPLTAYLDNVMFSNASQPLAEIVMSMGRSYHFEESHLPNMSHNFIAYQFGIVDPVLEQTIFSAMQSSIGDLAGESMLEVVESRFQNRKALETEALFAHIEKLEQTIAADPEEYAFTAGNEQNLIGHELINNMEMFRLGAEIRQYGQDKLNLSAEERIAYLSDMKKRLAGITEEHERLWLARNKSGGLERSMKVFRSLDQQLSDQLEIEKGGTLGKNIDRLKEKVIAGGANWYLTD